MYIECANTTLVIRITTWATYLWHILWIYCQVRVSQDVRTLSVPTFSSWLALSLQISGQWSSSVLLEWKPTHSYATFSHLSCSKINAWLVTLLQYYRIILSPSQWSSHDNSIFTVGIAYRESTLQNCAASAHWTFWAFLNNAQHN